LRLVASIIALCCIAGSASAHDWRYVLFGAPTERYAHAVLGDGVEYGALELRSLADEKSVLYTVTLPQERVFEDLKPRKTTLGADNHEAVVVVESHRDLGAQLAVYDILESGPSPKLVKRAATPHIGRSFRWLAPAGIADFDGDGLNDIAYVETPHLGKILKIVTLKGDELVPIVEPRAGFSNHSIGEDFITSGVRECDGRVELLTPDASRTTLMAVRVEGGQIVSEATVFEPSLAGIKQAKVCN